MADNLDILREKLQQLHEDYHSLKNHNICKTIYNLNN